MIRYEDHMIGDYVSVNGKIRRIEAITKKKIGFHIRPEDQLHYARLKDVFPIEITEELLWKIGFWKEPKFNDMFACADSLDDVYAWDACYIFGTPRRLRITTHVKYVVGEGNVTINQLINSNSCSVVARHLHELQRAFKICGIHFEIKL